MSTGDTAEAIDQERSDDGVGDAADQRPEE